MVIVIPRRLIILSQVRMISSMSFAALPWEFSIAWIADKESENITVSVGVELPLSNCCIRVSRVFLIAIISAL